jgi:hypothetical protein
MLRACPPHTWSFCSLTLSLVETKFLGSEEDCQYVDSTFQARPKFCGSACEQEDEISHAGGLYTTLAYNSPFGRKLDGVRIDIRSIEVDGDVLLFDDKSLIAGTNISCTCDGEVVVFDECTSPNVICSATFELESTLRVQWAASLDTKFQTATSTITLFVNNSVSSPSNITVAVGFDKTFKALADGEPMSYSAGSTTATVFLHGDNDEELDIKESKLVVEPDLPQSNLRPPARVEVRPAQKVVFISVPTDVDSYSVGIESTISFSSAVSYNAIYSFVLFAILQVVVYAL